MTDDELIDWCIANNIPTKMAALLSIWAPDYDELEEWSISLIDNNTINVNGDKYIVYTDFEQLDVITQAEKSLQDELEFTSNFPDSLVNYIDWDSYWNDMKFTLFDVTGMYFEEIVFQLDTFYYAQYL